MDRYAFWANIGDVVCHFTFSSPEWFNFLRSKLKEVEIKREKPDMKFRFICRKGLRKLRVASLSIPKRTVLFQVPQAVGDELRVNFYLKLVFSTLGLDLGVVVFHGSALARAGKGYIFLGQAGAGKSTILKLVPKKTLLLGDDSALIRRKNKHTFLLYSSPFFDRNEVNTHPNSTVPLARIFFIHQAKQSKREPLSQEESLVPLVKAAFFFPEILKQKALIRGFLNDLWGFCYNLSGTVLLSRLYFAKNQAFFRLIDA